MAQISIIIPAHNAAATLGRTLDSLIAQRFGDWRAIVVDDGSTDATAEIASRYGRRDGRITVLSQEQGGAAAARNAGLAIAIGRWVAFLDSDDRLTPDHLAKMMNAAARQPDADLLYGGWRRMTGETPWRTPHGATAIDDPMLETARGCPFAIHAAITRREIIDTAGRFDPALRIAEDWDLWQRIARIGGRFTPVDDLIAEVTVRPGSLSTDSLRHFEDGMTVIRRGHARDPRLPADVARVEGAPVGDLPAAAWHFALWTAGAAIGRGADPLAILERVGEPLPDGLDAHLIAGIVEDGLAIGAGPGTPLYRHWDDFAGVVAATCDWLGRHARADMLGSQIRAALAGNVADGVPLAETARVGRILVLPIDPAARIANCDCDGADRVRVRILAGETLIGTFEKPCFGSISARSLRDAIRYFDGTELRAHLLSARLRSGPMALLPGRRPLGAFKIYARLLRSRRRPYRHGHAALPYEDVAAFLFLAEAPDSAALAGETRAERIVADERAIVADAVPEEADKSETPFVAPDYTREDYWEEVFSTTDPWDYRNAYETVKYDQTIDLIRDIPVRSALEIACAEGEFTRRLAARADRVLATDIAPAAVARAAEACADLANCTFRRLDLLTEDPPESHDLIVCSEVLYYLEPAALDRFVEKVARHLDPGGIFLTAHANLLVDEPDRTGFGWPHHFGAKGIGTAFSAHPDLVLETEVWTPLYRIQRFRKAAEAGPVRHVVADTARPLPERVAAQVRWRGGEEVPSASEWHDVPVLMYHRIADDGPPALARWRQAPAAFEEQLAWLRDRGWRGVPLDRLRRAVHEGRPLPERCVVLTFDDATSDFLDHALPLLHRYGFPASLFVPTGHIGGTAVWDGGYGAPAPLLDGETLRALRHCDVTVGAHGERHVPLTALGSEAALRDLARSRFQLESLLGQEVASLAYPFGAVDDVVRELAARAGYDMAFTCADGRVGPVADPLALPRREVIGGCTLEAFAALVEGR